MKRINYRGISEGMRRLFTSSAFGPAIRLRGASGSEREGLRPERETAFVLFCIAVWLSIHFFLVWNGGVNQVFNWPDANANYHFSYRVFTGQPFVVSLPFEASDATSYLATRSTRVIGSTLVPIGFWGLSILYGILSRLLFLNAIVYISIVVAGAAVYAWYRICCFLLSKTHALLATLLLLIHPGWFYYTNETLLPNVLLVSLVIGIFFCLFEHIQTKKWHYLYGAAVLLALCVMVRPSELLWIIPLLILAGVKWRTEIFWRSAFFPALLTAVLCTIWLIYQASIMPSGELFGYRLPELEHAQGANYLLRLVAPFGFDPLRIMARVWQYGIALFWPFTLLSALGVVMMLRKPVMPHAKSFVVVTIVVTAILFVHYGSGNLSNTPNPRETSIDTSFVRYLLPVYLCSLLFAAHAFIVLGRELQGRLQRAAAFAIPVLFLVMFSLWISVLEPVHGIFGKTKVLEGYDRVASYVVSHTPLNALVVTERGDKYIWPHRLVMVLPKDDGGHRALQYFAVDQGIPTYLVSLQLTQAGRTSLDEAWKPYGLVVGEELMMQDDIGVYTIEVNPHD